MNGNQSPGLVLGGVKPPMPEITVYPAADVSISEGGCDVGDATHHLRIILPLNGLEIRIPYNKAALRRLARQADTAAATNGDAADIKEG